jgi:hypothetical protein
MRRIYEWIRFFLQEKINIFIKGATGGWLISGIFLFGSNIHDKATFLVTYLVKVFAVAVSGLISGFATVLGNDIYQWAKTKYIKKATTSKNKRKKAA